MPLRNKNDYNTYMLGYMSRRYERRRSNALIQLGGECVECGSTDRLEFDHVDPSEKSFNVAKAFASMSEKRLQEELAKCQLLCHTHHLQKTYRLVAQ